VAEEFGLANSTQQAETTVQMIRCAPALYPECPDLARIPHYLKFNRSRDGEVKVGDCAPDARLFRLNGTPTTLYEYLNTRICTPTKGEQPSRCATKPLVLVAGSYT
jgi:hypothetical protein